MQSLSISLKKIPLALLLLLTVCLLFPVCAEASPKKKFVVVIDAGHGGHDTGALENGIKEKDINLAVALKLGALIEKKLKDTEVIYTRDNDRFITLQGRANVANNAHADLFISIHCNSVDRNNKNRTNVVGATTFVLGPHKDSENLAVAKRENAVVELDADDKAHFSSFDESQIESAIIFEMGQKQARSNSVRLASDIQREMEKMGRVSRSVQTAGFYVLWSTAMPSVLVELDFLCNPTEAQYLGSTEGQNQLAEAIFNAVKNYESFYRKSIGDEDSAATRPRETPKKETKTQTVAQNTPKPAINNDSGKKETKNDSKDSKKDKNSKTKDNKEKDKKQGKDNKKPAAPATESGVDDDLYARVAKYNEEGYASGSSASSSSSTPDYSSNSYVKDSPKEIQLSSDSEKQYSTTRHRNSSSTADRNRNNGSHRRRSSSARRNETAQVNNSSISTESVAETDSRNVDDQKDKNSDNNKNNKKDKGKSTSKKDKKNKQESSKPARREKDKTTKKKAVKHNSNNVKYQILLFVSDDELKSSDSTFKGLGPVQITKENNKYNYIYGESPDRKVMEALLDELSERFPEARVITRYY